MILIQRLSQVLHAYSFVAFCVGDTVVTGDNVKKILDACIPSGSLVSHCKWLLTDYDLKGG